MFEGAAEGSQTGGVDTLEIFDRQNHARAARALDGAIERPAKGDFDVGAALRRGARLLNFSAGEDLRETALLVFARLTPETPRAGARLDPDQAVNGLAQRVEPDLRP